MMKHHYTLSMSQLTTKLKRQPWSARKYQKCSKFQHQQ